MRVVGTLGLGCLAKILHLPTTLFQGAELFTMKIRVKKEEVVKKTVNVEPDSSLWWLLPKEVLFSRMSLNRIKVWACVYNCIHRTEVDRIRYSVVAQLCGVSETTVKRVIRTMLFDHELTGVMLSDMAVVQVTGRVYNKR